MPSKADFKCPLLLIILPAHSESESITEHLCGYSYRYNRDVLPVPQNEGNLQLFTFTESVGISSYTWVSCNKSVNSNMLYIQLMYFLLMLFLQPVLYIFIQLTSSAFNIHQKMMCLIQFQSLLVFLFPNNIFLHESEKKKR